MLKFKLLLRIALNRLDPSVSGSLATVLGAILLAVLWMKEGSDEALWSLPIYLISVVMIQDPKVSPIYQFLNRKTPGLMGAWRFSQIAWWLVLLVWMARSIDLLTK